MNEHKLQEFFCFGVADSRFDIPNIKKSVFVNKARKSEEKRTLFTTREEAMSHAQGYLADKCNMSAEDLEKQKLNLIAYGYADIGDTEKPLKRLYLMKCQVTKGVAVEGVDDLLVRGV